MAASDVDSRLRRALARSHEHAHERALKLVTSVAESIGTRSSPESADARRQRTADPDSLCDAAKSGRRAVLPTWLILADHRSTARSSQGRGRTYRPRDQRHLARRARQSERAPMAISPGTEGTPSASPLPRRRRRRRSRRTSTATRPRQCQPRRRCSRRPRPSSASSTRRPPIALPFARPGHEWPAAARHHRRYAYGRSAFRDVHRSIMILAASIQRGDAAIRLCDRSLTAGLSGAARRRRGRAAHRDRRVAGLGRVGP